MNDTENIPAAVDAELLAALKQHLPVLQKLYADFGGDTREYEDPIYRF